MSIEKKFLQIKDSIEVEHMKAILLLSDLDEQMLRLSPGQLVGKKGIEFAAMMDALLQTEQSLRRVLERMENVGKAG